MAASSRPRRSVLYMPGSNTRALEKGRSLPADALILDLEDAVAADAKVEARDNIVNAINQGGYGHRELIVRINPLNSPWGYADLAAMCRTPGRSVTLSPSEKDEESGVIRQGPDPSLRSG